jgi:predicted dehydrogenase
LPIFDSADPLLQQTSPDVAVISTRPDHIADAIIQAVEVGCDIISEKPLGLSLDEVRSVREAVRENGVRLLPMLSMRTEPVFLKARELFRAEAIGEAVLINTRKSYRFGDRPEWFGDRKQYGGTFPWVGIHAVDMIHFITGLEFSSVFARHANSAHPQRPDCEDACAAIFELSNGAFATASVDLLRPESAPTHGDDWIRIAGTRGVLEASANAGIVKLTDGSGESVVRADSGPVSFYADFLEKGRSPLVEAEDGFLLTEVALCARDSADQGGVPVQIS